MINLKGAEVGDKFDSANERYELVMKSEHDYVIKGNGARLYVTGRSGRSYCDSVELLSKADPRHWLKDLPDADSFTGEWVSCDNDGSWFTFSSEPQLETSMFTIDNSDYDIVSGIKMPELTVGEWKASKISIDELRQWQKDNK